MDRKRIVLAILTSACLATSMLVGTIPSNAQINGFGTSTSGGSGGAQPAPQTLPESMGRVRQEDLVALRRGLPTSERRGLV